MLTISQSTYKGTKFLFISYPYVAHLIYLIGLYNLMYTIIRTVITKLSSSLSEFFRLVTLMIPLIGHVVHNLKTFTVG